ncbi:TonB-dependent receptor [Haloferula sp.]|uniref:TonB-dependent receptor n=1 Tax=Haloferula sp. TaxID=2497595 RepID=UPI00329C5289
MKSTYDKALELNLDPSVYGTFAEIGAGQETANWFFRASGTAGTVAKSISAYDMTMSDAIYGKSGRYVSQERLGQMIEHEFGLLVERLAPERQADTTFFSFCNTVRARGYKDSGECHGWLGLRFQLKPGDEPSEIFIHIRLLDAENLEQMEALGVVGVNLVHATFKHRDQLDKFAEALVENLRPGRVEVDMLRFSGNGYEQFDNRLCALQLVESGLTEATIFLPSGEVVQAADALYKRPILLLRGSFDPVTKLHLEMIEQARVSFCPGLADDQSDATLELCEISMTNLLRGGSVDHVDFIDRADALQALGKTVLISSCAEFHRIAAYLSRYTESPIGFILSIGLLNELFKPKWSANLAGGRLESFGRLFKKHVSLFVYPWLNRKTGEVVTSDGFRPPEDAAYLYRHLTEGRRIRSIPYRDIDLLRYTGRDIQKMILDEDPGWKDYVPEVAHRAAQHLHGREEERAES